jgi:polyadenylate-binding protein
MDNENKYYALHVSNLAENVSDGMLFEFFKEMGSVVSLRVIKDDNGKSLGYAYVNFNTSEEAERAIGQLNGVEFNGLPVSISSQKRRSGKNTVFVSNLPPGTTNDELVELFSEFGNVTSYKIVTNSNTTRLQGYVEFETEEEMKNAINNQGVRLRNYEVYVTQFVPRDKREKLHESSWTNVYIKNLPGNTIVNELNELFEPYGNIISSMVNPIEVNGEMKAFGYVNFEKHEDAVKAVSDLNETTHMGTTIYCSRAERKSDRNNKFKRSGEKQNQYYGRNLFIKNLDFEFSEEDLFREFSKYGTVTSVKIPMDEYGSKGIGYVCYEKEDMAKYAIQEFAINRYIVGCDKPLIVQLHEPRYIREERFQRGDYSVVAPTPGQPWYQTPTPPPQMYTPNFMLMDLANIVNSLNPHQLQDKPSEQVRQAIGNILLSLIHQFQPMYSTKITGMFLEWPVQQIYEVSMNPDVFLEAIQTATQLLIQGQ